MTKIELSIIVPVFNGEKYIKRCIDSILSQRDIEYEIIIINDGSTDNTSMIIGQYIDNDRIIYIEQDNSGVSSARNKGIETSSGKYIVFVDADDYLPMNSLAKRIDNARNCDLLISGIEIIETNGKHFVNSLVSKQGLVSKKDALRLISPQSKIEYQGFPVNKVFSTDVILRNNLKFDETLSYGEDRLFVGEYITYCNKIIINSDVVYIYEKNNDGAISTLERICSKNEYKIMTEFDGLKKIENVVRPFSEEIYRSFRYYEFRQAVKFIKKSDKSAKVMRKHCAVIIVKRFFEALLYAICYIIPERLKIK